MANKFTITITAVDKATAIVKKINKATGNITRPIENISKSMGSLGREVRRNPIIAFAENLTKKAVGAASAIGSIVTPLGALGAVASVAGIMKLAESLGNTGIAVTNAATRIGVSVGTLQLFRGAATAAGLSADGMQSSLVTLGDTLQDALQGRNQQALQMLGRLGIDVKRGKDGIVDTAQAYSDLADAIKRNGNPQAQALIARTFGIEDQLPILQKGAAGLREYQEEARKAGVVNEKFIQDTDNLGKSWARLKLSSDGFLSSIGFWGKLAEKENLLADFFQNFAHDDTKNVGRDTGIKPIRGLPSSKSEALGIRLNNPMNLQPGGVEAKYSTPADGIEAGARNLVKNYQGLTIDQIANKYTPPNAPGNSPESTSAWAATVSRETGIARDAVPNLNDSKTLAPLISAIIKSENNKQPYGKDMIESVAQKVTVEVHLKGNTSGVSAVARSDGPNMAPPTIHYAMPGGITS